MILSNKKIRGEKEVLTENAIGVVCRSEAMSAVTRTP